MSHKRHNVSNHRQLDCFLNRIFRLTTTRTLRIAITFFRTIGNRKTFPCYDIMMYVNPGHTFIGILLSSIGYTWGANSRKQSLFNGFEKRCIVYMYIRLCCCYLPKFTILASMFVCRFVTCQNFQFLQVCSFVGLSVCLSVLSSITHERFDISSPNLVHIWNGWAVPVCDIDK